jgi:hypothetical protein
MSNSKQIKQVDFEKTIMAKVKSNEITMKPRWYFVIGSFLMVAGLVGFSIGAIFITNITLFLLRRHGPMGEWRLQLMLNSFPWWVPILAIVGIVSGIWLLKKYDFSYKKNFLLIVTGFVISIFFAAFILDNLGLNDVWSRQGPMRRFYNQIEGADPEFQRGPGQGSGRMRKSQLNR